ncbi:MAG: ABC transporter ATP-binding protein [Bacteroidota bacterium]
MDFLVVENVSKRYATHQALTDININVPKQCIYGLLGPNGAGKTTLIRIVNQIIAPDSGRVFLNGEPLQPSHISMIGYLPEERGLYKKMKVGEQALYLAQLKGVSKKEALKKLKYWFEKFEIQAWWDKKVEELSKGMQQKIQFIVTVIHQPTFLIFDEPFSGFDPINVNLLKEEIFNLREQGATIIFSTHNMESVEELCDNIALINKSNKILEGKVRDIKKTYKANTYKLCYTHLEGKLTDILPSGFDLISEVNEVDNHTAIIKLPIEVSSNQLIQTVLPHLSVHSFNEILPSMNDIFITQVNGQK